MDLIVLIQQLTATPEYWAGVGSTLFILLAGLIIFMVFGDPAETAQPATPDPDWLKPYDELSRAAAAREAKSEATRWGRRERRDVPLANGKPH